MNNPAKFIDKYEFEITFECLEQLEHGMVALDNVSFQYVLTCYRS